MLIRVALVVALLAGCRSTAPKTGTVDGVATASDERRPVVVQGAMDLEIAALARRLDDATLEAVSGWRFWRGTLDGYPVIVSKTMKGVANAAAATAIAAERFQPAAIINQGTSGGHDPELHVYDIVLGASAVSLGAFKTAFRKPGEGSDPLEWTPLDLLMTEGSAGEDPREHTFRHFPADAELLALARGVRGAYRHGRIVEGVIASGEIWNSELDRIQRFHETPGTTVEDMETASAAQIASFYRIPFLGIRVLSNNITNGGAYDAKTGEACQEYVFELVRAYVAAREKREQSVP